MLPSQQYWIGTSRESASEAYGLADGTAIKQVQGMTGPATPACHDWLLTSICALQFPTNTRQRC